MNRAGVLLVTPVFKRYELTKIMLTHRARTFELAEKLGVKCQCVVIGDPPNLATAKKLGFHTISSKNILGKKYNDGHSYAAQAGYDKSLHCNSDQVFSPELLVAIGNSPSDKIISTHWLTFVHKTGTKSLFTKNPQWALNAFPVELLRNNPRPCQEDLMSMCDTSTYRGVAESNHTATVHDLYVHPLECIQFESDTQLTPWEKNLKVAAWSGFREQDVPWEEIALKYGPDLVTDMKEFYGIKQ